MKSYKPPFNLAWYYGRGLNGLGKSTVHPTKTMEAVMTLSIRENLKKFRRAMRKYQELQNSK